MMFAGALGGGHAIAGPGGVMPGNKRPMPPTTWVEGPAVTDAAKVRAWLDGLPEQTRVRLPVTVIREPFEGRRAVLYGAEKLPLDLDDSAMGISLADRLREACGDASPCTVWLEGQWRPKLLATLAPDAMPGVLAGRPDARPLAVRAVAGLVAPDAAVRVARAALADAPEPPEKPTTPAPEAPKAP